MQTHPSRSILSGILAIALSVLSASLPLSAAIADTALHPPFKIVWSRPDVGQLLTWKITKGIFYYVTRNSLGALRLSSGQDVWERQTGNDLGIGAGIINDGRVYCALGNHAVEARSLSTGATLWTFPAKADVYSLCIDGPHLVFENRVGYVAAINTGNLRTDWETRLTAPGVKSLFEISNIIGVGRQKVLVLASTSQTGKSGVFVVLCLSAKTGDVLWRSATIHLDGNWSLGNAVDAHNIYVAFANDEVMAFSLRDGRTVWHKSSAGNSALLFNGNLITNINDDGTVYALDCTTGRVRWSTELSKKAEVLVSPPALFGSDMAIVADQALFAITSSGKVKWRWPVQDSVDGTAPVIVRDGFLLPVAISICRFVHGRTASLPRNSATRQSLARELVSRLDSLSVTDKRILISLGDDAFLALRAELKRRELAYGSTDSYDDYSEFTDCAGDIAKILRPKFTGSILQLLPLARLTDGDQYIRRVLLGMLDASGDQAVMLKVCLHILVTEKPDWGKAYSVSWEALSEVCASNSKTAVKYLVSELNDEAADPEIRREAYLNVGRSGDPAAISAILAHRNTKRTAPTLDDIMQLSKLGLTPNPDDRALAKQLLINTTYGGLNSQLIATAKDSDGRLWGLAQSGVAGAFDDLWILRNDGNHWAEPLLTNLTRAKLGNLGNFLKYVHAPEFTRDTDGDGWTDLLEQRLGTNPNAKDTDHDGLADSSDKNPLAASGLRSETEQIIAAAFEAHFWSTTNRAVPCLVSFPKGIAPFELRGSNWLVLGVPYDKTSPLGPTFDHGTAFVDFGPPMLDFDGNAYKPKDRSGIILWNKNHTRARIYLRTYYGGVQGTGMDVELKKIGTEWIVTGEELQVLS